MLDVERVDDLRARDHRVAVDAVEPAIEVDRHDREEIEAGVGPGAAHGAAADERAAERAPGDVAPDHRLRDERAQAQARRGGARRLRDAGARARAALVATGVRSGGEFRITRAVPPVRRALTYWPSTVSVRETVIAAGSFTLTSVSCAWLGTG